MFRKNWFIKLAVVAVIGLCSIAYAINAVYTVNIGGKKVNPGELHTPRSAWDVLGATLAEGDEPNDLAVGERTYLTVLAAAEGGDDKIIVFDLRTADRQHWNRVRFRCIGVTDGGNIVYQVYFGTLGLGGTDCILAPAGELDFVIGTQASTTATYEVADTLTVTPSGSWTKGWGSVSPTGNLVAEGWIDLIGADIVVLVPTTVGCNCKVLGKGY